MIAAELFDHHQLRTILLSESNLAFVLDNPSSGTGGAVIYVTDNPAFGKLNLTIANNSGSVIEIGTTSILKIFVSPPLAASEVTRIKVTTPDWNLTVVDGHVELRRASNLSVAPKANIAISLADVMTSGEATTSSFRFEYSGFRGIAEGGKKVIVVVQRPPTGEPAPLSFGLGSRSEYAGQQGATVYITPWNTPAKPGIANHIVVQAGNSRPDKPIASNPKSDSKLVISFTTGNSDLSLCTDDQIKVAAASMAQSPPAGPWRINKDPVGAVPVWAMRPPSGAAVFDAGGMVAFRIDGIVSQLPADFASPMFIQFANIPGYNDGFVALFLQKISPVPFIRSFDFLSGTQKLPSNPVVGYRQKISLAWDVFAAESCRIVELKQAFSPSQSTDVFPEVSALTYTLSPEIGGQPYQDLKLARSLSVAPPVVQLSASSSNVYQGGRRVDIVTTRLAWNCSNGSHCTFTYPGGKKDNQPLTGFFDATSKIDETFSITCNGATSKLASLLVEVPSIEASIVVDCRGGYLSALVRWDVMWARSFEVSEPGFQVISKTIASGAWNDPPFGGPDRLPLDPTRIVPPGQPRWVRHFRIVATRTNTVVKDVYVTDLRPLAQA